MLAPALIILWLVFSGEMLRRFLCAKNDQSANAFEERWRVTRLLMTITVLTCGAMLLAVVSASIYTFVKTPDISEIPVFVKDQLQKAENKLYYFVWLSFIQSWFFIGPALSILRWEKFRLQPETIGKIDIHLFILIFDIFWTAIGANFLYGTISYYAACLQGDCSLHWQSAGSGNILTNILMFLGFIVFLKALSLILRGNGLSSSLSLDEKVRITRMMFLASSVFCGVMLMIVAASYVYVFQKAGPQKISGGLSIWIIFVQFWLFLGPFSVLIRPGWLRRKTEEYRGSQDQIKGGAFVILLWTFFAGLACYSTLLFYGSCLNGECNIDLLKIVSHRH